MIHITLYKLVGVLLIPKELIGPEFFTKVSVRFRNFTKKVTLIQLDSKKVRFLEYVNNIFRVSRRIGWNLRRHHPHLQLQRLPQDPHLQRLHQDPHLQRIHQDPHLLLLLLLLLLHLLLLQLLLRKQVKPRKRNFVLPLLHHHHVQNLQRQSRSSNALEKNQNKQVLSLSFTELNSFFINSIKKLKILISLISILITFLYE